MTDDTNEATPPAEEPEKPADAAPSGGAAARPDAASTVTDPTLAEATEADAIADATLDEPAVADPTVAEDVTLPADTEPLRDSALEPGTPQVAAPEQDAPHTAAPEPEVPQVAALEPEPPQAVAFEPEPPQAAAFEPPNEEPVALIAEPALAPLTADGDAVEPMTMAELLDQPDHEVKSLKHGDVVEGTVVRIDPDEILVDFGGKSEGVVSNRELISRRGGRDGDESRPELKVGDEVLVYVLQPESPEGHAVLSLRRAGLERKWRAMQERFDAGEIVEARVIDHNKGGLIVDLGVRGFVPISQIVDFPRRPRDEQPRDAAQEIAEKLQPFVGRALRLKILEVNRKANRLILSEKVALYEERREKRDELFSSLQVGQRVQGQVRSIAPFGVFVDLGGIDGLVHKSELSWNKVNNPETAYQIGEEVEAEVIDINHERGRISLSIRRLQPDPWQESVAKYKIGDVIDGTVTKLVNFGAFVRVEEGLEGLIHISELSHQRVAHPGDVVKEGQQVSLKIISLDSERHRLGLSLKQVEDRPAPPPREDRPRRDRGTGRRDRFDYRPEDATAEPEGGIDSTMAAAFAESGLLDQFRTSPRQADPTATAEPAAEATAELTAQPIATVEPTARPTTTDVEATAGEAAEASDAAEPDQPTAASESAESAEPVDTAAEATEAGEADATTEVEAVPVAEAESEVPSDAATAESGVEDAEGEREEAPTKAKA